MCINSEQTLHRILETKSHKNKINAICSTSYLSDWHKKLDASYYINFCNKRELARMNLTLNTYTQWYWKTDLLNLMNFLRLRYDIK